MQTASTSPTFEGLLYGRMGHHLTKKIICCPHGDAKFVRFVNKIAHNNSNAIKVSYSENGLDKLIVETKEIPKLNFLEMIFSIVSKAQLKALRMRKQGKIESFIYQINEIEYDSLKKDYPFIGKKQLTKFAENVKSSAPDEAQNFLKKFFR